MSYKLYLDDYRQPVMSFKLMLKRVGENRAMVYLDEWVVVKHYAEFIQTIKEKGMPELISFDHDLADAHYNEKYQNGKIDYDNEDFNKNYFKTGYHCARWLLEYCTENELEIPPCLVHSQNPVGVQNICALLKLT